MTNTPHDIDEHHVVYKGQLYRCIAVKPYIRADGSATQRSRWRCATLYVASR